MEEADNHKIHADNNEEGQQVIDDHDRDIKEALINKEILEKGHAPQDFDYYLQKFRGKCMPSAKEML